MTPVPDARATLDDPGTLLAMVAAGDQRAWSTVIDVYGDLVASVPRSMRLRPADSDDVCQATWLALLENAERIREPQRLRSWLITVARREAMRLVRQAHRHVPVGDEDYLDRVADPTAAADDLLVQAERYALLRRAIESLPQRGRRLVHALIAHPEASYIEVAGHMGIPVGSIGPVRARCINHLRAVLA